MKNRETRVSRSKHNCELEIAAFVLSLLNSRRLVGNGTLIKVARWAGYTKCNNDR